MGYSENDEFKQKQKILFHLRRSFARYYVTREIEGAHVLEIGGADGVLGGLISGVAGRTIVTSHVNAQVEYGGQFPKLLKEKFERNGYPLDLGKIEFHAVDARAMPYRDVLFDIVLSSNAFEHTPDPFVALQEVLRMLKSGGVAYLTFDPIWTADTGSQFSHYVLEPWAHLLYSTDAFVLKMREAGAAEWEVSNFIYGLRIQYREYEARFNQILGSSNLSGFHIENFSGCVEEGSLQHKNLMDAAARLECDPNDLLVRGFIVIATK
jgi:ubiquinone/menaquinone biosynthesis C-methylase UbiE